MSDSAVDAEGATSVLNSDVTDAIRSAASPATEALLLSRLLGCRMAKAVVEACEAAGSKVLSDTQLSDLLVLTCVKTMFRRVSEFVQDC